MLELKERTGVRATTLDRYRGLLERINAAIGHIKLADLRPQHLNAFYKNLAEPGLRATGGSAVARVDLVKYLKEHKLSRASVAEKAGISSVTVGVAVKGEAVTEEKAAAAKTSPPKVEKHDPNYFQPGEIASILNALEKEPLKWQFITHLLLVTGCRRGEIMGLQWEKVDFDHNRVKIDKSLETSKSNGIYLGNTKTSGVRWLNLPRETMDLLRQHKRDQLRLQLANGDRWVNTGFVFTQDNGEAMNPTSITCWLREFSARHDLPHINPHAFRHTVASVLLANGTDIVTVSKQLSHASVNTTENFYSHIIEENKVKASECIADVLLRKKA